MTDRLPLAIAVAVVNYAAPSIARLGLRGDNGAWAFSFWDSLDGPRRDEASSSADALATLGWGAIALGDSNYPGRLAALKSPPPVLFYRGDIGILRHPTIGMCGSRKASDAGLRAARVCAATAARAGLVVASGNAVGVDTEAHIGALEGGSATVLVLPEGALHYRPRRVDASGEATDRVLVVSQFPPRQPWSVGGAMTRNAVIAGIGDALVVIEAGSEGGTLNAGKQALAMGRPVIALEFDSMQTPPGNAILHAKGALRLRRAAELADVLSAVRSAEAGSAQLGLVLG